jgi:transposase
MKSQKKDCGLPPRLSLDEFARRKGKGQFATILTDLDKSSLLEVIDSHKSEDIITVLKQQPLAMREGVKEVCVDMWGGFPKVIREVFPNAKTVIDRFHVQKLINKAAHRPGGNLQVVCDKTALNKIRLILKLKGLKNRFLLMSNQANLITGDRSELEMIMQSQ